MTVILKVVNLTWEIPNEVMLPAHLTAHPLGGSIQETSHFQHISGLHSISPLAGFLSFPVERHSMNLTNFLVLAQNMRRLHTQHPLENHGLHRKL